MADFLALTAFAVIIVAQAMAVLFARPYQTQDDAVRAAIDGHSRRGGLHFDARATGKAFRQRSASSSTKARA
jgi:hypothetical protein